MFKHKDKKKGTDKESKNDKDKKSKRKSQDKYKTFKEERRTSSKKPKVPDTPKPNPPSEKKSKTLVRAASDANIGKIQPKRETSSEPLFQKFPKKVEAP